MRTDLTRGSSGVQVESKKAKDMQRMPPTTELLSRNFLDETFVKFLGEEQQREVPRSHNRPGGVLRSEFDHSASRLGDLRSAGVACSSESVGYKRVSIDYIHCLQGRGRRCDACPSD
jgi:hypothetical protein